MTFTPGIYDGIDAKIYHAHPAISNSYLSRLDKCPAAAKVPQETTAAMAIGSAVHCLTLEGETAFWSQYAVAPKCDKRTKDGKAEWEKFISANPDREIIGADDFATIHAISEAVHAHPFAAKLLEVGKPEQSVFWTDGENGLEMKCRADWLTQVGVVVDLKTTDSADERAFTRSIVGYGYHRQAAFYLDGIGRFAGVDAFAFIAVEKKPPYRVEVYTLDHEFIEAGRRDYRRLIDVEHNCRAANTYPAFQNPGVTELCKPAYL